MKRFIFSILCVSVFFIGVGALVERTGAKFKSDEKALALIAKARIAIGGDAAINGVQSMVIVGKTTHSMKLNGIQHDEQGETEIALELPDKMMKMGKIGHSDGTEPPMIRKQVDVVVVGEAEDATKLKAEAEAEANEVAGTGAGVHKIIIKADGTTEKLNGKQAKVFFHKIESGEVNGDGTGEGNHIIIDKEFAEAHHNAMRQNELLRTTLGLLLTAPAGVDVNYTYGGDGDVDGTSCGIVVAEFGGSAYRLYLSKASSLPVMMSYKGLREPHVFTFRTASPQGGDDTKQNMVFTRRIEGSADETAEFNMKFSDYRSVGGVQFPYKWVRSGGEANETFDVTSYEINPANIAEKFQGQKVMMRMKKSDGQ